MTSRDSQEIAFLHSAFADRGDRALARRVSSAAEMELARAGLRRGAGVGGFVLLEGADRAASTTLLQQTASDLAPTGNSLILRAAPLGPEAVAREALEAFGQVAGDAPVQELLGHAERCLEQGEPLLLMVEGAEVLPAGTVRWIASLASGSRRLVRVVLAAADRRLLLEALAGSGTCVDLVRLETDALVPATVDAGHVTPDRSPAPAVSAPTVASVQTGAPSAAAESIDADVPATPTPAANHTEAEVPPAAAPPVAKVAEMEPADPTVGAARPEWARLYTIEELLGNDTWTTLERPASDDLRDAGSPKASGTGNGADRPAPPKLEAPRPRPAAARPGRGPERPPSPPARGPRLPASAARAAGRRDSVSAARSSSATEREMGARRAGTEAALVVAPRRPRRAVWPAVFAVLLLLGIGLFRLLGPSASDRVSPPSGPARVDVAARPVDVAGSDVPSPPVEPMPPAQVLPAEPDAEALPAEERPVPPREPRVQLPPSEVEAQVKRAIDDLLEEDRGGIHEDALARLVELGPQLAGPELVRQINARRRGVRTYPPLRNLWKRARAALCESAERDPSAGPPPPELSCPRTPPP